MAVERTFRGITARLAVHYLENLGGETVEREGDLASPGASARVEGNGWTAELASSSASIGPSLQLTEVAVTFEGEDEALDGLVEAFARKATRAGG